MRCTRAHRLFILVGLAASVPHLPASAEAPQSPANLAAPRNEAFTGEIAYDFDSVINQTTATFIAPLGKRDFLHRLFSKPTVHTMLVSYRFNGRVASRLPDTIRVQFESDDYVDSSSLNPFDVVTDPTLTIAVGGRTDQYPLSISQRVELETRPRGFRENMVAAPGRQLFVRVPQARQARIRRRATAWLSGCEFLSMIDQTEIRGTVGGLDFNVNRLVIAGLNRFAAEMLR